MRKAIPCLLPSGRYIDLAFVVSSVPFWDAATGKIRGIKLCLTGGMVDFAGEDAEVIFRRLLGISRVVVYKTTEVDAGVVPTPLTQLM